MATLSGSSTHTRVWELNENNYGDWAPQERAWIRGKNGIKHIEPPTGTSNPPVFPADAAGIALKDAWYEKDNVIASRLLLTLTPSQKQHIVDEDATAATIWQTIKAVHRQKGFTSYYSDSRLLESTKYVDGTSMQAHLHTLTELRKRITAAGLWLPEAHYCGVAIASLPDSWEAVTLSLLAPAKGAPATTPALPPCTAGCLRCVELTRRGLPDSFGTLTGIDWTDMSNALIAEELRRKQKTLTIEDKGTALTASSPPPNKPNFKRGYTKGAVCDFCLKRDHVHTDCWTHHGFPVGHPKYNAAFVKPPWPPGRRPGAVARAAVAMLTSAAAAPSTPATADQQDPPISFSWTAVLLPVDDDSVPGEQQVTPPPSALALLASPAPDGTHHWVVDSGASSHFCTDRSLFSTFTASTNRHVQVAAGDVRTASGFGTVEIDIILPDGGIRSGSLTNVIYMPDMHSNLVSVARLADAGMKFAITSGLFTISARDGSVCAVAERAGAGLYRFSARGRHSACASRPRPELASVAESLDPAAASEQALIAAVIADAGRRSTRHDDQNATYVPQFHGVVERADRSLEGALVAATAPVDWHARFGHADVRAVQRVFHRRQVAIADEDAARISAQLLASPTITGRCEACLQGKQTRAPLTGSATGATRATYPLQLVHIDLCGPFPVAARGGYRYLCVIVDDCTHYLWLRAIAAKSAAFECFRFYKAQAEAHHAAAGHVIRALRSDNGGEFISNAFSAFLDQGGIRRQLTAAYTPQQNGVVERANRTIVEGVRTTLQASGLPRSLWAEAAATTVYVRNRLPTTSVAGMTPYEAWYGKKPSVDHLRPLGCVAHVLIPAIRRNKLDAKSHRCFFVGYSTDSHQYRLYDPEANTVLQSRDVVFDERVLYRDIVAGGESDSPEFLDSDDDPEQRPPTARASAAPIAPAAAGPAVVPIAPALPAAAPPSAQLLNSRLRSHGPAQGVSVPLSVQGVRAVTGLLDLGRGANRSGRLDVRSAANLESAEHVDQAALAMLAEFGHDVDVAEQSALLLACTAETDAPIISDPLTLEEALASPFAEFWIAAMQVEIDGLIAAGTYRLVKLPVGHKAIANGWVFATKRDAEGNIIKYKARLVAKGCAQRYGIDYEETFAPVCRIGSIRVLVSLAAHFGWETHHMDVTSAYLNGDLEETVYMRQPPGFEATGDQAALVCKLDKALYGLKQAGRTWNQKINKTLQASGFTALDADLCVYKCEKGFAFIIISLYVDDLLLFSNDLSALTSFKAALATQFAMKDLGEAKFVLGIEIIRNRGQRTIALSQASYTRGVLRTYGMEACNAAHTPVQPNVRLAPPAEGFVAELSAIRKFQAAVGALMWAAICTRPDIAFAVGQLCQYASNPDKSHFTALTHCLRYLRGTVGYRLSYRGTGRVEDIPAMVGYSDADWAGDVSQRRSTTGYVFLLCGAAVSWQSKRQKTIAQSSMEAEYMAGASTTKEGIWLIQLLTGIGSAPPGPVVLRVDNEGAIKLANNPHHHELSKHIAVRYHLIRHHIAEGTITLLHVSTDLQVADCFTKGLPRERHAELLRLLGME